MSFIAPLAGALAGALVPTAAALVDVFVAVELLFDVLVPVDVAVVDIEALLVCVDSVVPLALERPLPVLGDAEADADADAEADVEAEEGVPEAEAALADATVLALSITKYGL